VLESLLKLLTAGVGLLTAVAAAYAALRGRHNRRAALVVQEADRVTNRARTLVARSNLSAESKDSVNAELDGLHSACSRYTTEIAQQKRRGRKWVVASACLAAASVVLIGIMFATLEIRAPGPRIVKFINTVKAARDGSVTVQLDRAPMTPYLGQSLLVTAHKKAMSDGDALQTREFVYQLIDLTSLEAVPTELRLTVGSLEFGDHVLACAFTIDKGGHIEAGLARNSVTLREVRKDHDGIGLEDAIFASLNDADSIVAFIKRALDLTPKLRSVLAAAVQGPFADRDAAAYDCYDIQLYLKRLDLANWRRIEATSDTTGAVVWSDHVKLRKTSRLAERFAFGHATAERSRPEFKSTTHHPIARITEPSDSGRGLSRAFEVLIDCTEPVDDKYFNVGLSTTYNNIRADPANGFAAWLVFHQVQRAEFEIRFASDMRRAGMECREANELSDSRVVSDAKIEWLEDGKLLRWSIGRPQPGLVYSVRWRW
jgi:hypothetical protein